LPLVSITVRVKTIRASTAGRSLNLAFGLDLEH
jgi:hypothetical protein